MPHINLDENLPGMRALLAFSPQTAAPLGALTQMLMRDTTGISPAEREMIGMYVSSLNDCFYCNQSHAEIAICYLHGDRALVEAVRNDYQTAPVSDKLKSLLRIAGKVQRSGKAVLQEDIDNARAAGASDRDIHDTVLIAAAFCLMNRYVDGLATITPDDLTSYPVRAKQVAEHGYGPHIYSSKQPTP